MRDFSNCEIGACSVLVLAMRRQSRFEHHSLIFASLRLPLNVSYPGDVLFAKFFYICSHTYFFFTNVQIKRQELVHANLCCHVWDCI